MEYISSDTNVWIDFDIINKLELPFLLPFTYIMEKSMIANELIQPNGLGNKLEQMGLLGVELTIEEMVTAEYYFNAIPKLSRYDCVALAIAINRKMCLLTGDALLRKTAIKAGVKVKGTIGILDMLYKKGSIEKEEYLLCLTRLKANNHRGVRLPEEQIQNRIEKCMNK